MTKIPTFPAAAACSVPVQDDLRRCEEPSTGALITGLPAASEQLIEQRRQMLIHVEAFDLALLRLANFLLRSGLCLADVAAFVAAEIEHHRDMPRRKRKTLSASGNRWLTVEGGLDA